MKCNSEEYLYFLVDWKLIKAIVAGRNRGKAQGLDHESVLMHFPHIHCPGPFFSDYIARRAKNALHAMLVGLLYPNIDHEKLEMESGNDYQVVLIFRCMNSFTI